ncbi:hypothetical protein H1R20_g13416, partial [Candolleomyces eurysporus]
MLAENADFRRQISHKRGGQEACRRLLKEAKPQSVPASRQGNLIIRRNLSGKDRKSSFTLNGQPATGKEVTAKMAELNVQVENLCNPNLSSWFKPLKEEGKHLKVSARKLKDDQVMVKQLRERNENIERDVERFREREKLEKEVIHRIDIFAYPILIYCRTSLEPFSMPNPAYRSLVRKSDADAKKASEKREQRKKAMVANANVLKKKQGESDKLVNRPESLDR